MIWFQETTSLLFISQIDQTQKLYIATNDGKPVYYYHISFYEKSSDLISQAPRFRGPCLLSSSTRIRDK